MLFFIKQETAYELRMSGWSSDVCSSELEQVRGDHRPPAAAARRVEEPPDQAEGGDECRLADLGGINKAAHEQPDADRGQIGEHEGLHQLDGQRAEHIGAGDAADQAGTKQTKEERWDERTVRTGVEKTCKSPGA